MGPDTSVTAAPRAAGRQSADGEKPSSPHSLAMRSMRTGSSAKSDSGGAQGESRRSDISALPFSGSAYCPRDMS